MAKYEVVPDGYGRIYEGKITSESMSARIGSFANRLFTFFYGNDTVPMNGRTASAVSACIMYDDTVNRNGRMRDGSNFLAEAHAILLKIRALDESNGFVTLMNGTNDMMECVRIFSRVFFGEIDPDLRLGKKMCFLNRVLPSSL